MITGDDLMAKFEEQVRELEIRIELDEVNSLLPTAGGFSVKTVSDQEYKGKTVILTQGKKPRKLNLPKEDQFIGRGLSVCATCDGPLFKEKVVGVIGGGNSALTTALEMSAIAKEVHLIVRSTIRADAVYVSQYEEKKNIITHNGYEVTELLGDDRLSGIVITHRDSGEKKQIQLDGLFAEIGWIPNTSFVEGLLKLNDQKEIIIDIDCRTSAPGIFAAGDVTSIAGKQIIIACGEGAKAALSAFHYLMTR